MVIVTYDIADDKLRTKFSKFLSKFGHRLQYSVFEIRNSERILDNVKTTISTHFEQLFQQTDSVIIFHMSNSCKIIKYGYARNDETDLIIL